MRSLNTKRPQPPPMAAQPLLILLEQCFERKAWHGPHLLAALRGVGVEVAVWRPQPLRKNIAEQALHTAYWKYVVRRKLRGDKRGSFPRKGSNWFPTPHVNEGEWNEIIVLLIDQHRQLVGAVTEIVTSEPAPPEEKLRLITGIAAHDVYHAGQIRLLRSMFENRPA